MAPDVSNKTIGELVAKTEAELLKYRNFGPTSLEDIKKALKEMGLSLGMESRESVRLGD